MFLILVICSLDWCLIGWASAQVVPALAAFVQRAVPAGEIRYWGAFAVPRSVYYVFSLQQAERRGVLLVRKAEHNGFEIVGTDTSFDSFRRDTSEESAVVSAAAGLLNGNQPFADRAAAPANDVCPLGASLNTLLVPIAGFTLRSNGTLGILRELQQSDAYSVEPESAPPGSILICPTRFSAQGPVIIGFAVIVGPDRCVYGPDYRVAGAWHKLATLSEWLSSNQSVTNVSGFLLRANHKSQPPTGALDPNPVSHRQL
jgi:hypothetical protein